MRPKSMILIVIALGCGLVASIGISQVMENRTKQSVALQVETEKIYVAMVDVPIGEPLSAQTVKLEEWPKDKVPEGAIRKLEDVEGRRPRQPLYSGEPILSAKLIDAQNVGGAAERIPKGFRVVSVKVTMDSAASGLILPGDRVDVLVFLKRGDDIRETGTRTILRDVTVFAVNDRIDREVESDGSVINARTVSLLVKPAHVEKLMLAGELGKLRLSLRRADDRSDEVSIGATVSDLDETEKAGDVLARNNPTALPGLPGDGPADGTGILGFLDKMKVSPAVPADTRIGAGAPAVTMDIHTPEGVNRFHWDDRQGLPREFTAAESAPATPSAVVPPPPPGARVGGKADLQTGDDLPPEVEDPIDMLLEE
jgi:pilus assembly protein CpaB